MQQRAMSSILALLVVGSAFTAALPGRTILDTQTAIAISTPTTLAASSSPGASATAIRESLAQTPQLAPAPTTTWDYGICPLVVVDADFFGNDIAEAKEPDVATCCNECLKSLNAWRATNASGVPSKTDNACVAWTFTVDKVCYLKNSIQNASGGLTAVPIPGSYTGSFYGNITAVIQAYDQLINQYLIPIQVRSTADAVANAGSGQSVAVNSSCTDPHCQQIVARLNTTAIAVVASG